MVLTSSFDPVDQLKVTTDKSKSMILSAGFLILQNNSRKMHYNDYIPEKELELALQAAYSSFKC